MIITNKYNLPETIVKAASYNFKPKEDRYSVTDVVNPPLVRHLRIKHWDEIKEDISSKLWLILGSSVHSLLEKNTPEDSFQEEKLTAKVTTDKGIVTVVGKSDLWEKEIISDWKITSVYSFLMGEKPEWEAQLNIYAWLWSMQGFNVNKLQVNAILRDWSQFKAIQDKDYPKIPFMQTDIPLWDKKTTYLYILNRIGLHQMTPPPECTPEEKWQKPTQYALKKKGAKRAIKLYNTQLEADLESDIKGKDYYVEERLGQNMRCENYCNVNEFCPYYKKEENNG